MDANDTPKERETKLNEAYGKTTYPRRLDHSTCIPIWNENFYRVVLFERRLLY